MRKVLTVILALILIALLIVGCYAAYLNFSYYRISDNQATNVENNQTSKLSTNETYSAITYNFGFGAYTPDFSFFMDSGEMSDGTKTQGKSAKAVSAESVEGTTKGSADMLENLSADFLLIQEIDTNSDRSRFVNQVGYYKNRFSNYGSSFAINLHTSYLFYPPTDPIGIMNSGILTLSKYNISSSIRRSYPVSDGFIEKLVDLDRCFQINRIPVEGTDKELVLINSHMSAYDEGGKIRELQMQLLTQILEEEHASGNWVIAGGDWNHALCDSENYYSSQQNTPSWLSIFDESKLKSYFSVIRANNIKEVATCRGSDISYEKGVTHLSTVDGFIVSDNVSATAENVDSDYQFSDHNPVKLEFKLMDSSQHQ